MRLRHQLDVRKRAGTVELHDCCTWLVVSSGVSLQHDRSLRQQGYDEPSGRIGRGTAACVSVAADSQLDPAEHCRAGKGFDSIGSALRYNSCYCATAACLKWRTVRRIGISRTWTVRNRSSREVRSV